MSNFHKEKEKFLSAVRVTSKIFGFSGALIEKDYYCSLILKEIFQAKDCNLIFKGGTLLNKVHAGFYRLSEDLDFAISVIPKLPRKKRSASAQIAKKCIITAIKKLELNISKPFKGQNENRMYSVEIEYKSLTSEDKGRVKMEFGIQETVLETKDLRAKTLLVDSITQEPVLPAFSVKGLSLKEAYSEKIRAALSRVNPAVRDIFDVHYAVKNQLINIKDMIPIVKHKLGVLNRKIDLSAKRRKELLTQFQESLEPVLRQKDFEDFDFEQAWNWLKILEKEISKSVL